MLTLTLLGLVVVYLLLAIQSLIKFHAHEDFRIVWSFSAGYFLFLAVGLLRMSAIARSITVSMMWIAVLLLPVAIYDPSILEIFVSEFAQPTFYNVRAVSVPAVVLCVIGLMVLNKYRKEFR